MTVARSNGVLLGTSDTVGVSIAAGAQSVGSSVDVLGDNASFGDIHIFLMATPSAGKMKADVLIINRYDTGTDCDILIKKTVALQSVSGQQRVYLGMFPASRYMSVTVKNESGTFSGDLRNVSVLYELEKVS